MEHSGAAQGTGRPVVLALLARIGQPRSHGRCDLCMPGHGTQRRSTRHRPPRGPSSAYKNRPTPFAWPMRTVHTQSLRTFVVILRRPRRRAATDKREAASRALMGLRSQARRHRQPESTAVSAQRCVYLSFSLSLYIYIYIYTHTNTYIYIYIYIYHIIHIKHYI